MAKIGILTFHRSINCGAVAQCYSLTRRIQKDFPDATVEVIDYVPQFRLDNYNPSISKFLVRSFSLKRGLLFNIKLALKKISTLLFHREYLREKKIRYKKFQESMSALPLSEKKYRQNDVEEFCKEVQNEYDVIVVGSDCVWEWTTVPFPNAYYLCGKYGAVKLSYAASVGTDDHKKLSKEQQKALSTALADFFYVGVRDTSSEYVVKGVNEDLQPNHNCDPSTFFDVSELSEYKKQVEEILVSRGIDLNKPIVGIMGDERVAKLAKSIFGNSVQYVALYASNHLCDVSLVDLTVLQWTTAFSFFDITFTTYFHGTMFSLVNLTPVISLDYLPETTEQITKLHELYSKRLDLPGFYHRGKQYFGKDDIERIGSIAKHLIKNPPKEKIAQELCKESESYMSFYNALRKALSYGEM